MIDQFREWAASRLRKVPRMGELRLENYLLLAIAIAVAHVSIGFWFGVPCRAASFYIGFGIAAFLAGVASIRTGVKFVVLVTLLLAMSLYCFSYSGIDSTVCHAVIQRLLINGWNPVFQSSIGDVERLTGGYCSLYHVLFMPKLHHLLGAVLAKATGMFLVDSYLSYAMAFVMFCVAHRFAALEWKASASVRLVFALVAVFPTKISTVFGSMLDYSLYCMLACAILSYFNYVRSRSRTDLLTFFTCASFAMLMKPSGLLIGGGLMLVLGVCNIRSQGCRRGLLVSFLFVTIVGASPYITAWVRYGSFLYPTHSFDTGVQLVDITNDFTANADGEAMGYFARIVYAWFSKGLAVMGSSLWNGSPDFNPKFYVPGGVAGLKDWFRPLMWMSVLALIMARKNRVTFLCVLLFALSNAAPLRYIGYSRYFMLIWLIPPLALLNFTYHPLCFRDKHVACFRVAVNSLFSVMVALTVFKSALHYIRLVAVEGARQRAYACVAAEGIVVSPTLDAQGYFLRERIGANNFCTNHSYSIVRADAKFLFPDCRGHSSRAVCERWPECHTLSDVRRFDWRLVLDNLPGLMREK